MGLFKLMGKKGAARTLARSAHEAYLKHKKSDPDLTEAEIAQKIFIQRCSPGNLNKEEKVRYEKYTGTEQKVDSLFKLCTAMTYILLNITKADARTYDSVRKIIEQELTGTGHKVASPGVEGSTDSHT
jgi:hypothetical protein